MSGSEPEPRFSHFVSRASALLLLVGGLALLFAADAILPALVPGYPPAAAWLGQLLGAAWLALAGLNWHNRFMLLGGIYGRPVVSANCVLYLVGALVLVRAAIAPGGSPLLWWLVVPSAALAVAYAALMFRGPFDPVAAAP